ncbi:nocathioamide family RiPP precursor [Nocardia terpenica]
MKRNEEVAESGYDDFDLNIIDSSMFDDESSRPAAPACHTLSSLPCCAN